MATNPPVPPAGPPAPGQPAAPVPPKKSNALLWILAGIGGFVLLIILVVAAGIFFFVHKAKQAGLDPDLLKKNPALAAAKLAVAVNPDVEMVSTDEGKGEITIRDKKTGKVYSMSFEDAKNGKFTMKENGKEAVTITGGPGGTVEMKSADGTIKIGGGNVTVPAWVPDYPGSQAQSSFTSQTKDGDASSYQFKTKDPSDKVVKFYADGFKNQGMKVTSNITSQNGASSGGMLVA